MIIKYGNEIFVAVQCARCPGALRMWPADQLDGHNARYHPLAKIIDQRHRHGGRKAGSKNLTRMSGTGVEIRGTGIRLKR